MQAYCNQNDLSSPEDRDHHLQARGWSEQDLAYFATKQERLNRFQQLLFAEDVELSFLARKTDLDEIHYSLIRVRDGNLAFELHQRLIEAEEDFGTLASLYSEDLSATTMDSWGPFLSAKPTRCWSTNSGPASPVSCGNRFFSRTSG